MRSGPGAARTILLFHIISARPSKQPRMVRTFLKVYMELGSYFLFLQEQRKDIILIIPPPSFCAAASGAPTRDRHKTSTRRQYCKGCCWAWRCVTSCCTGPCRCGNMNPPPISRLCTLSRKPHPPGGRGAHLLFTLPLQSSLPPILSRSRARARPFSLARASARALSLSISLCLSLSVTPLGAR